MKPFPIRVEKAEYNNYKIVEWMLHNVCNYDCSFCGAESKNGSRRWLDIETYKKVCKQAIIEAGKPIWFKFTGGEPTLYPKLIELLKFVKEAGGFTYVISNGSRTLRYWRDIAESGSLDFLSISYHPEQTTDYQHIIDVLKVFQSTETMVTVNITCIPKYMDAAVIACEAILAECATIVNLQQINDSENMSKYSPEQIEILTKYSMVRSKTLYLKTRSNRPRELAYHEGKMRFTYSDSSVITDMEINFIKRGETYFQGWECDIGKDSIRIEHETVYRAVCGQGNSWTINDPLFATSSLMCDTPEPCTCTLDVIAPKRKQEII